jgi:hypothetical protein
MKKTGTTFIGVYEHHNWTLLSTVFKNADLKYKHETSAEQ